MSERSGRPRQHGGLPTAEPDPREPFASTPGVRRRMQAMGRRDTAPEMALRRLLHGGGLRYRVDARPLPELNRRADLVFRRDRVAVFVDGCFWHGCPDHGRRQVRVNTWYWPEKIARNVARDRDTDERLADAGWTVVRVWEHEDPAAAAAAVRTALDAARADDPGARRPPRGTA